MATHTPRPRTRTADGKRVLYKLLLIAVAVVYTLVFVLDYLLKLGFTYFLLLSLFIFVLATLLYMWVKVSGVPEPEEEENAKGQKPPDSVASPFTASVDPMDWPEAVFLVNARTGLTITANAAAVRLFFAGAVTALTGIDLTHLFAQPWSEEESRAFREKLRSGKSAVAMAYFRTLTGVSFRGVLQADRMERQGRDVLLVRVLEAERLDIIQPVNSDIGDKDSFRKMFDDGAFPMVQIGPDYKIRHANRAFTDLLAYKPNELEGVSVFEIIHPEEHESERRILSQVFRGEAPLSRREKRYVRRTNEVIWVSLSSSMTRDEKGSPFSIITLAENVTQRKRVEHTVRDNRDRLQELVENDKYAILSVDKNHTLLFVHRDRHKPQQERARRRVDALDLAALGGI
ncbi:MAG: PAS domain-containing protein [Bacteroidota bacterium]